MEMERLAYEWVRRCEFEHPDRNVHTQYKGIGQNLAIMTIGSPDWLRMAQGWYNEIKDYDYASDRCRGVCGHYTQMIWAKTTEVGCAAQRCDSTMPSWNPPVYLLACQYKPSGNWNGQKPYESGRSCSGCPEGSVCHRNQCVTGSLGINNKPTPTRQPMRPWEPQVTREPVRPREPLATRQPVRPRQPEPQRPRPKCLPRRKTG
ncbi:unnamed protein product [Mesocestoides corti]|nr:unnamed protein product [Mesocestoides corti]